MMITLLWEITKLKWGGMRYRDYQLFLALVLGDV